MTGVTSGAETADHSGAPEITSGFCGIRVAQLLVFGVVFCRQMFVFFPSLSGDHYMVLSFVLRLLITCLIPFELFFVNNLVFHHHCGRGAGGRNVH